jgi:hypothetical protein
MKKIKLFTVFIILLGISVSQAQVSVNVNIGSRPAWGPTVTTEEYYYLPDIDSYYDIHQSQFIYLNNGRWIRARSLPRRYGRYNLNTGYVVVLNDYHGLHPYYNFKNHRIKYYKRGNNWERSNRNDGHRNNGKGHHKR